MLKAPPVASTSSVAPASVRAPAVVVKLEAAVASIEIPLDEPASIVIASEVSISKVDASKSIATSAALPILIPPAPSISTVVAAFTSTAPTRLVRSISPPSEARFSAVEPDIVNAPLVVIFDAPTASTESRAHRT